jgi:hypothetical protein
MYPTNEKTPAAGRPGGQGPAENRIDVSHLPIVAQIIRWQAQVPPHGRAYERLSDRLRDLSLEHQFAMHCRDGAAVPHKHLDLAGLALLIGEVRKSRALGVDHLQAAAGRIISRHPSCPASASRLVDRLIVATDLAAAEGRP